MAAVRADRCRCRDGRRPCSRGFSPRRDVWRHAPRLRRKKRRLHAARPMADRCRCRYGRRPCSRGFSPRRDVWRHAPRLRRKKRRLHAARSIGEGCRSGATQRPRWSSSEAYRDHPATCPTSPRGLDQASATDDIQVTQRASPRSPTRPPGRPCSPTRSPGRPRSHARPPAGRFVAEGCRCRSDRLPARPRPMWYSHSKQGHG